MEIRPFREDHIEEAGELFKKKYKELKGEFPFLPTDIGNTGWITDRLVEIANEHPGFIAIRSGKLIGYMIGYTNIQTLKGSQCGAFVPEWGNAAIAETDGRIYTNLYKEISRLWVESGYYTHIVSFLANKAIDKTMSLLGFGMQVIDAARDLTLPKVEARPGVAIERASEKHISQLRELERLINVHLESAPIFLKRFPAELDDNQIRNAFLSKGTITIIATKNDRVLSCIRGKMNYGNTPILNQKGAFGINFGYTREEYRNSKIATMVLRETIEAALQNSASMCSVNFETQNTEGRTFWLSHFSPIVYSMMRKVDDRF